MNLKGRSSTKTTEKLKFMSIDLHHLVKLATLSDRWKHFGFHNVEHQLEKSHEGGKL